MTDSAHSSRAWLVALTLLAVLSCAYALSRSLHRLPDEAAVVEGRYQTYIRVDSEHGALNGWFSPEVVYDVYVDASDGRQLELWATPDTAFYRERGGDLVRVSVGDLDAWAKVRAHVGEIDHSGVRPTAYAVRVIAAE